MEDSVRHETGVSPQIQRILCNSLLGEAAVRLHEQRHKECMAVERSIAADLRFGDTAKLAADFNRSTGFLRSFWESRLAAHPVVRRSLWNNAVDYTIRNILESAPDPLM